VGFGKVGIGRRYFRVSRPVAAGILGGFGAVPGLPGPFAALARQVAGEITDVTDCSWLRDSSAVWRLTSASSGCWYLKRHSSDRFHTREVAALQDWAQALGPERAPELAATDPELLIMVITAVPGQPVLELQPSAREEREVHRQAGSGTRLAASWASSTGNAPSPPRPSATSSGWNTARGTTGPISASTSSQDTGARSPRRSARC